MSEGLVLVAFCIYAAIGVLAVILVSMCLMQLHRHQFLGALCAGAGAIATGFSFLVLLPTMMQLASL